MSEYQKVTKVDCCLKPESEFLQRPLDIRSTVSIWLLHFYISNHDLSNIILGILVWEIAMFGPNSRDSSDFSVLEICLEYGNTLTRLTTKSFRESRIRSEHSQETWFSHARRWVLADGITHNNVAKRSRLFLCNSAITM